MSKLELPKGICFITTATVVKDCSSSTDEKFLGNLMHEADYYSLDGELVTCDELVAKDVYKTRSAANSNKLYKLKWQGQIKELV